MEALLDDLSRLHDPDKTNRVDLGKVVDDDDGDLVVLAPDFESFKDKKMEHHI